MFSLKNAKEGGNREHHTHRGTCVAFYLLFAACSLLPRRSGKYLFISQSDLFLNWSFKMKGYVDVTQSSNAADKTKKKNQESRPNPKAVQQGLQVKQQVQQ